MAEQILDLVYLVRRRDPTGQQPSIRAAIMLARVLACRGLGCDPHDPLVVNTCRDVLHLGNPCGRSKVPTLSNEELQAALDTVWGAPRKRRLPHAWPAAAAHVRAEEVLA